MRSHCLPNKLRISTGAAAGAAEPVRQPGVELGRLARRHGQVVIGQHQPEASRQDVEPFVALVDAGFRLVLIRPRNGN
jgi:hypothetical protein